MQNNIVRFLAQGGAVVSELSNGRSLLLERPEGRRLSVRRECVAELIEKGAARLSGDLLELTDNGPPTALRDVAAADRIAGQHRDLSSETIIVQGQRQCVVVNNNESPLAALARRRNKTGKSFLEAREYNAGERLRADYTRAQIMPRLGVNWDAHISSGRRGGNGIADLSDSALAARQRVDAAIDSVGPELAGVLVDVCCFLKGLETVEAERGWPARSAKILLKAALSSLSRHYEPERKRGRVRMVHWGAEGYRPRSAL